MKVGDYVRTKYGYIAKIIVIKKYKTKQDEYYFDWDINQYEDGACNDNMLYENELDEIIASSPNIIDLIEVGDYVNGKLVTQAEDVYTTDNIYIGKEVFVNNDELIIEEDIKSIVTHEQFESMEYKIGE